MSRFAARIRRSAGLTPPDENLAIPFMDALAADSLVDTIGVGLHASSVPYSTVSLGQFTADLTALGVRHVRMDRVTPSSARQTALINAAPAGTSVLAIMDDRGVMHPDTSWAHVKSAWNQPIFAVSGPNEPQIAYSTASAWPLSIPGEDPDETDASMSVTEAGRQQSLVYDAVNGETLVASSPLALRDQTEWYALQAQGMASPLPFDAIDMHVYQGGRRFQKNGLLATLAAAARDQYGQLPVWLSETGYHNLVGTSDTHKGTSEAVAAIYAAEFPYACQTEGFTRAYFYELYNETDLSGREANFGLYSAPGTPKPIATALGRILGRYTDAGSPHTAAPLRVQISGGGANFRSALHQKRDGTWLLAMWRRADLWDFVNMTPIAAPSPLSITITLGTQRLVTGYTPTATDNVTTPQAVRTQWTVSIAEHIHIFEIAGV